MVDNEAPVGPDDGDHDVRVLPVDHRARPAVVAAVWVSVVAAVAFGTFACITTQVHAVRAGSPWQDDPYDGVVSFTEFLVPALAVIVAVRASLCRRDQPQPVFRLSQLLRAAFVCTLLIAATVGTDWLAVAVRADRPLWNGATPWLVWSLVALAAVAAVSFLALRRAFRRLPPRVRRRPGGDWLDDLAVLVGQATARLPPAARSLVTWMRPGSSIGILRRHIVAFAVAASLTAGLLETTAEAIGQGWTSPLLFLTGTAIGAGGFFAFSMLCNTVLSIAVPRDTRRHENAGGMRRAAGAAAIVGALALPAFAVLRDDVWATMGLPGQVDSPQRFAAVTFVGALVATVLTFATVLLLTNLPGRQPA